MDRRMIGVAGLGLIGGSMCKALIKAGHVVVGMDKDSVTEDYARLAGIIDDKLTPARMSECDYIFVALYPQAAVEFIRDNASLIKPGAVVMDLCGVKRAVCQPCFDIAREHGFTYIGGHPMAGTQFSGIKYARDDMFQNATMVMVTREDEDIFVLGGVRELLHDAGFKAVTLTTADKHDEMIAFTSQLAHVVSNAYVKSPTARAHHSFSAGSYRDLTRVAKLNETMWTELFLDNADYLCNELDWIISALSEYRDAIKDGNADELKRLLREGRERKEEIDTEWKR
ncbi:MAG: prephenate dehydrogenase [Candidatus Fimadaptatus sp.]|jgi:prephenate dehydrogenase